MSVRATLPPPTPPVNSPEDEKEAFALKPFLIELAVYAVLVFAYFFLVLHYLTGWFKDLFDQHRFWYAAAGLAIMIGQAVGLEYVTRILLSFGRLKKR